MQPNDSPSRAAWPPAVRALLSRRSRIAVVICDDARAIVEAIASLYGVSATAPLRLASPAGLGDVLAAWCGVEPSRPDVAVSLLAAARLAAGFDANPPSAASTIEGRWRFEGSPGRSSVDPAEASLLRGLIQNDGGDPVASVGRALREGTLTPVERFQHLAEIWGFASPPILIEMADPSRWGALDLAPIIHAAEVSPQARLMLVTSDAGLSPRPVWRTCSDERGRQA